MEGVWDIKTFSQDTHVVLHMKIKEIISLNMKKVM